MYSYITRNRLLSRKKRKKKHTRKKPEKTRKNRTEKRFVNKSCRSLACTNWDVIVQCVLVLFNKLLPDELVLMCVFPLIIAHCYCVEDYVLFSTFGSTNSKVLAQLTIFSFLLFFFSSSLSTMKYFFLSIIGTI